MSSPLRVAVTGAAGQISYSLLFRIAAGNMLGAKQPVILQLLEIPPAMKALDGVVMELMDCAFPNLVGIVATDDPASAFGDADYILLVGARPRSAGMERSDLLEANAQIFTRQGEVIDATANKNAKTLVVGNPANTNALITMSKIRRLDPDNITAMTRLDHNRAVSQLAEKTSSHATSVRKVCIWGNHSATQYPDIHHAEVDGRPALDMVDTDWMKNDFIPRVQKRGTEIIQARGVSSAASAASSAMDHIRLWAFGTADGDWTSMGVPCKGQYGVESGLIFSFPMTCSDGQYSVVEGLQLNDFSREKIRVTEQELCEERDAIRHLL